MDTKAEVALPMQTQSNPDFLEIAHLVSKHRSSNAKKNVRCILTGAWREKLAALVRLLIKPSRLLACRIEQQLHN
jgi:hypothetical protein